MSGGSITAPARPSPGSRAFGFLQRLGRALMVPVAILPAAGLLLGIGVGLQQPTLVELAPWLGGDGWVLVSTVMINAGSIVFTNLGLLFGIGVAIGLAGDAGVAALAAAVGYLVFHVSIQTLLDLSPQDVVADPGRYTTVLGIPTLQTGIFGGLAVGILAAWAYRRFSRITLPVALGFFAGKRFVPIAAAALSLLLGALFALLWPPVEDAVSAFGRDVVLANPVPGAFVFGLVERALIPFGLQHTWYPIFWYQFGDYTNAAGNVVIGDQRIWFAQLADGPNQVPTLDAGGELVEYPDFTAGTFMTGRYPVMMFGLPAAALAMYLTARTHRRKVVAGLFLSAALASFLTGITEPLEFTFLFVAPLLFAVHAAYAGLSFMLMEVLDVDIGLSFSGGLIDFLLFGVLPGRQPWWLLVLVGLGFAVLYFVTFYVGIRWLDAAIPGREEDEDDEDDEDAEDAEDAEHAEHAEHAEDAEDVSRPPQPDRPAVAKAASTTPTGAALVAAFGGRDNIVRLDACITRLRIEVRDPVAVDEAALMALGAAGVVRVGGNVQAVFGPAADALRSQMQKAM